MIDDERDELRAAATIVQRCAGGPIDCAVVLGTGLAGALAGRFDNSALSYADLPGMPEPSAPGHQARALIGMLDGRRLLVFDGRFHLYEGFTAREVVQPIVLAAASGARTIVVTNAAGALNPSFAQGDVMLVTDHINLTAANPLAARTGLPGRAQRFVDMAHAYAPGLRTAIAMHARQSRIELRDGVYAGLPGPSFETPAEVNHLRMIGADAVGMSTVLEVIAARAYGCDVAGLSSITNVLNGGPTAAGEIVDAARRGAATVAELVCAAVYASPRRDSNADTDELPRV